jgi:ankyrin repeat protein
MRDCRTKGETPLHRAAAFGDSESIKLLLDAGAIIDARDANGDTSVMESFVFILKTGICEQIY